MIIFIIFEYYTRTFVWAIQSHINLRNLSFIRRKSSYILNNLSQFNRVLSLPEIYTAIFWNFYHFFIHNSVDLWKNLWLSLFLLGFQPDFLLHCFFDPFFQVSPFCDFSLDSFAIFFNTFMEWIHRFISFFHNACKSSSNWHFFFLSFGAQYFQLFDISFCFDVCSLTRFVFMNLFSDLELWMAIFWDSSTLWHFYQYCCVQGFLSSGRRRWFSWCNAWESVGDIFVEFCFYFEILGFHADEDQVKIIFNDQPEHSILYHSHIIIA